MKKNVLLFLLIGNVMVLLILFFVKNKIDYSEENVKNKPLKDNLKLENEIIKDKLVLAKKHKKEQEKELKT